MGLVEEIATSFETENDDMDEAANANFDNDRENHPNMSNPNLFNNLHNLRLYFLPFTFDF